MDLVNIISIAFGGLGLGSILTIFIKHTLDGKTKSKELLYKEKRESYIGLLKALHQCAVKPSEENAKTYALWQTHCTLFGSETVIKFAQEMIQTNSGPKGNRDIAYEGLLEAMREDLRANL